MTEERIVLKVVDGRNNQYGVCKKYLMICLECRREFWIAGGAYNQGIGLTCGNVCKHKRQSKRLKGKPTWIKGKTKENFPQLAGYWSGKRFSDEHRKNLSIVSQGRIGYWKDKKRDIETIHKQSATLRERYRNGSVKPSKSTFKKGHVPVNKGKKMSIEHRMLLSKIHTERPNRYWLGKERLHMKGDRHWNWAGGKSFEPYSKEFTKYVKNQIRKRDNYTCRNCGKSEETEKGENRISLTIHHVDYDKKNCSDRNLITVCRKCNLLANKNRDFWKKIFQSKISKIYS